MQAVRAVDQAIDVDARCLDAERRDRAAIDLSQGRPIGPRPHVESLATPAEQSLVRQLPSDSGQRTGVAQVDMVLCAGDAWQPVQRGADRRRHKSDRLAADQERRPRPRQPDIVAGTHMALKSRVIQILLQAVRLSNDASSCHMRSMRRSSHTPAPADLPASLRVERSTLQTIVSLLPYMWPAGNLTARIRV